jgi:hypothetical protein
MAWAGFAANPMAAVGDFRAGLIPTLWQSGRDLGHGQFRAAGESFAGGLGRSVKAGWEMSFKGTLIFNAPMAAFAMGQAERGHKLSAGVEAMSTGIGALAGGMLFGLPGAIVGGIVGDMPIAKKIGDAFQSLHDFDRRHRKLGVVGDYQDTEAAATMRQQACREMAGSLQNARQWLGREGSFMHS